MDAYDPALVGSGYCRLNSSGIALCVLVSLFLIASSVLIGLRIYTRTYLLKSFWWDDATLTVGYLISIAACALQWKQIELGLGRHLACRPPEDNSERVKYQFIVIPINSLSLVFTRTSITLFIIRLFAVKDLVRKSLWLFIFFMDVSLTVTSILVLFQCDPISAFWDKAIAKTARCWSAESQKIRADYNGAVSIFSDFFLALLPAYFLASIQMPLRRKIGIAMLMAAGLVTGACAVVRTVLLPRENQDETDPSYNGAVLNLFGAIETQVALIAATIPALLPLFKRSKKDQGKAGTTIHSGRVRQGHHKALANWSSRRWRANNRAAPIADRSIRSLRTDDVTEYTLSEELSHDSEPHEINLGNSRSGIMVSRGIAVEYS